MTLFLIIIFLTCPFLAAIFLLRKTPDPDIETGVPLGTSIPSFDERQAMFSRAALKPDSERFKEYYQNHPEHVEPDTAWRNLPGLMSPDSLFADPHCFAAADASFRAVFKLHSMVEGDVAPDKVERAPTEWSRILHYLSLYLGARDAGITELRDYHLYSHIGRGDDYGMPVNLDHPFALALTVEMNLEALQSAPKAQVVQESARQYFNSGAIAVQIAAYIRSMGYRARAHIDANYRVICPLVARDAGLGEIGRMGLLMTPRLGPRVRIAVVTTEMPLEPVPRVKIGDPTMIEFCELCKKCANTCPGKAISIDSRECIDGVKRWRINSEKCFTYWCKAGTDCGRCMAICPYSHPDNPLHNVVRWGIRRNRHFRRLAVIMDDVIYGRNPKPRGR